MTNELFTAIFFILFTLIIFILCNKLYLKLKLSILNPVLTSTIIIISLLFLFKIPYSTYNIGGRVISSFLGPLVVVLAIPLYKNRQNIMKNFVPIIVGITTSIITAFVSVILLSKPLNIDYKIMTSLLAKSITTPMAVEATKLLGGIESITIISVVLTGQIGGIVAPLVMNVGKIKNDIAKGIGIGSSSHALGTSKAIEMGEEIGAASGLAIGLTGLMTIIAIVIFA